MTPTDLTRLRELLGAATPGPWYRVFSMRTGWVIGRIVNHQADPLVDPEDAELACELRNAAPDLLDMAERLGRLESAIAYLSERNDVVLESKHRADFDLENLFEAATELGWQPKGNGDED